MINLRIATSIVVVLSCRRMQQLSFQGGFVRHRDVTASFLSHLPSMVKPFGRTAAKNALAHCLSGRLFKDSQRWTVLITGEDSPLPQNPFFSF